MPLTGDALKIRGFNLDPWSVSVDHFTAAWAMTDDGLYRATGLPDAATWTKQLDDASAGALLGISTANCKLQWSFTPSVLLAGFIMCVAGNASNGKFYTLWSTDYGANWNVNTAKWVFMYGYGGERTWVNVHASPHLASTYYATTPTGWIRSNQDSYPVDTSPPCGIWKCTTLPDFQPAATYGVVGMGLNAIGEFLIPYCNNTGNVYANDEVCFIAGHTNGAGYTNTGTGVIRKFSSIFTPPWSIGYTDMEAGAAVGHADMGASVGLVCHMFNDDIMIAWEGSALYVSTNGGSTWTKTSPVQIGGNTVTITSVYSIPADPDIFFLCGELASGGICGVAMSIDFGATFTDIGLIGAPGGIDSVMSLAAGDAVQSQIQVDHFKA